MTRNFSRHAVQKAWFSEKKSVYLIKWLDFARHLGVKMENYR
jgi:hypothetical protein